MSKPVIGFAGMTHLGINSAAGALGHGFETVCFDADSALIQRLKAGELPVSEPGLPELLNQHAGRVLYTDAIINLSRCDVVYIATDVPTDDQGQSDLSGISLLIKAVAAVLAPHAILVVLCQVPPGFTRGLAVPAQCLFYQVETLVFGRAVERAMQPERFIVGCADAAAALPAAYLEFLQSFECPLLLMRYESAELAKIAINCCLVASVTVANTLAGLAERIGANWHEIVPALKLDRRIGPHAYLAPGLGLAGGNLERDLATVLRLAGESGSEVSLIEAFMTNSRYCRDWVLRALHREVFAVNPHPAISVLGLAYKENTRSTKNSPSLALLENLKPWRLRVYDPAAAVCADYHPQLTGCASALDAAAAADVLIVMTPWPQFRELDPTALARAMSGRLVIDPYRVLDGEALVKAGLRYLTLGSAP